MEYKKHKITEAVCAFNFQDEWDIVLLSEYSKKIEDLGFSKRQDIKPIQVNFQFQPGVIPSPTVQEGGVSMVIKNQDETEAVLMSKNYISFHTLNHYPGWDVFFPKTITPLLKMYFELGLGKGVLNSLMLFVNNFEIQENENLSEYLNFVPNMNDFGKGTSEVGHFFQSNFKSEPNLNISLKTVFNANPIDKSKKVTLECSCTASNENEKHSWEQLAEAAHLNAKNAFIKITQDKFKKIIT
jgi:uncharacterized protein (TIGR04255 family)